MVAEDSGSEGTGIMEEIQAVGHTAARNGGILEGGSGVISQAALDLLQHNDFLHKYANGALVLSSELLAFGMTWSDAVLERTTRTKRTGYELKRVLLQSGWKEVSSARDASLSSRTMLNAGSGVYYSLLANFYSTLLANYERISHCQSDGYYRVLEAACIYHSDASVNVPLNQKAEFYSKLLSFLDGLSD